MSTNEPTENVPPSSASADEATPNGRPDSPQEETPAADPSASAEPTVEPKVNIDDLHFWYDENHALQGITMDVQPNKVTALIGPSGCGKSTFLRCINRMNDLIDAAGVEGDMLFDGKNVYDDEVDPVALRRRIGMVFQQPNPFPKSIYDNVAYGLRIQDRTEDLDRKVETALERAALWEEVNDRLDESATGLSGGQQQRLCIARAIAVDPEVILMDEPASALDPIATSKIEDLIEELAEDYTVVIVTHNMQQAARISDRTAVFLTGGELVEYDDTQTIFENPEHQRVEDYITGKFG